MIARGALIKPWIFREAAAGDEAISPEERLAIYRRYVALARAHWGEDDYATIRIREFLLWHLGFWCRYAPRREDGSYPSMQGRESRTPSTPLDALLSRTDAGAHAYLADRLLAGAPPDPDAVPSPSPGSRERDDDALEAG
jgi:hypothetical protein